MRDAESGRSRPGTGGGGHPQEDASGTGGHPSPGPDAAPALRGHVDAPLDGEGLKTRLVARGWHATGAQPALAVAVTVRCGTASHTVVVPVGNDERWDVARATGVPALAGAGWRAVLDISDLGLATDAPAEHDLAATVEVTVWGALDAAPVVLPSIAVHIRPLGGGVSDRWDAGPPQPLAELDQPADEVLPRAYVYVGGWALLGSRPAARVEIFVNGTPAGRARLGLERFEVAEHWGTPYALICGFEHLVDLATVPHDVRRARVTATAVDPGSGASVTAERWFELEDPVVAPSPPESVAERRRQLVAGVRGGSQPAVAGASRPLSLGVFTHSLNIGGAQLWLDELLRRTNAGRRYACTVVAPADGPLRAGLEAQGVEVHITPEAFWRDRAAYEGRVTELALLLAARGHDVVLANTVLSLAGADAGLGAGCPVVWAIHESWPPRALWPTFFHPGEVDAGVEARFEEVAGAVAALSFTCESSRALYGRTGRGHTVLIPWGVDVAAVDDHRKRIPRAEARAALGVPDGDRLLIAVGTTEPRKGQTILAGAFVEVATAYPDARLAMVGGIDTGYGRALREVVAASGLGERLAVVPLTPQVHVWYRAADALICNSDVEMMPRVLMEAMAFGLPVASTDVFGVPEFVVDGWNGFRFELGDRDGLIGTLRRLLDEDPARLAEMAERGEETVRSCFDSAAYAADVLALLEGLRDDPGAAPADVLARAGRHPERRLPAYRARGVT